MIFNSVTYLLFIFVVILLYWMLPRVARIWMLFAASLLFYGFWRFEFTLLMLASAITDYVVAQLIFKSDSAKRKKVLLYVSLVVNLGLLIYFKYLYFFTDNLYAIFKLLGFEANPPVLNIILPLGISFYTFQTISYTVDVYRGFIKPEKNFPLYATYVTFFPQLIAGPILRASEVINQLSVRPKFDLSNVIIGFRRIMYGLFLKVFIADVIAPKVDKYFASDLDFLGGIDVWTMVFMFGLQVYFDFCSYSHIAIGTARVMGIVFPENFNFPYLSSSLREFWKRWHISLSSWIRDYLYLPMTGAKVINRSEGGLEIATDKKSNVKRSTQALFATWIIMGLWHGANWNFVVWGFYHALFIYIYRLFNPLTKKLPYYVRVIGGWMITQTLVMSSWVLFRAESLSKAFTMYGKIFDLKSYRHLGLDANVYIIAFILTISILIAYAFKNYLTPKFEHIKILRYSVQLIVLVILFCTVFINLRPINQYIYFQF